MFVFPSVCLSVIGWAMFMVYWQGLSISPRQTFFQLVVLSPLKPGLTLTALAACLTLPPQAHLLSLAT